MKNMLKMKTVSLNFQKTKVDFFFFCCNEKNGGNDKTGFHKHFNYELHFAINGFYEYEFLDKKIVLHKNQMLIIPPHLFHKSVAAEENGYEPRVLTIKLSSEEKDGFFDYFNFVFQKNALKCLEIRDEIVKKILKMYDAINAKSCLENIYLTSCAADVLYELCNLLTDGKNGCNPEGENDLYVQIENLVNNCGFSLKDIAKQINYSPRQTERLIKKLYGKSLKEIREEFE